MELCFITCNIRFENAIDGIHSWDNRKHVLTNLLLSKSPDLIATQEGRNGQLKELEKLLIDYTLIDKHRPWIKERMYPSLFIKNNQFSIIESGDHWLSETPDIPGTSSFGSTFPRLMTWARLCHNKSNQHLMVVNTHLDHVQAETRIEQTKVLTQQIKRFWKEECPIIIMGDFNEGPDGEVRKYIIQEIGELLDSWSSFNKVEESSHHAFKGESQNGSRIDWILLDPRLTATQSSMDKSRENEIYPTDHYPVICRFKL